MKKLINLFNPTYAIICNQGTGFNSCICMTKNKIIDYYDNFAFIDLDEEDYENYWKKYKSLELISENWEVIIFKSKIAVEDMSSKEWRKAIKKNDIFGNNVFESIRVY
jgi:hypothetical protein